MIKIIGTNHLMKEEEIDKLLDNENPDVIGIELCEARVEQMVSNAIQSPSENKSLLGKIGDAIKKKAEEQKLDYGSDMKAALSYSFKKKIDYVAVDMPILKIQELFNKIPKEEQQGFAKELKEFESKSVSTNVDEEEVVRSMKAKYPIAFEFLLNMRNLYIANQILITERENPGKKIVIILGAAHVNQVNKLIRNYG
jgi:pheromone shutdown protein TraB